jgi:hypothetical protein
MRTVQDSLGVTWICLELPQIPADAVGDRGAAGVVALECNSGAHRVQIIVPGGWEDAMDDGALVGRIDQALGR